MLGKVKMIMATNRPDVLDPALLRPGRLDRKIEIPLPNEQARVEILKIHAASLQKHGEIDYEAIVKLAEGFNGADMRNICTEAGMFAIRDERDYAVHEDFMKARSRAGGGGSPLASHLSCACVGSRATLALSAEGDAILLCVAGRPQDARREEAGAVRCVRQQLQAVGVSVRGGRAQAAVLLVALCRQLAGAALPRPRAGC